MKAHRRGTTIGTEPFWEAEARHEAARLGLSETKLRRRIEKELLRLVAEKIANHEITRWQAPRAASKEAAAQPSSEPKKRVRREKVSMPRATAPDDATQNQQNKTNQGGLTDGNNHPA
jgi:hypothetical protein